MELEKVLDLTRPIYAHTPSGNADKEKETLQEHTKRCEKYFQRLLKKDRMMDAFQAMEPILLGDIPEEYREWFSLALYGVVSFHDTGKINPRFQQEKMGNSAFGDVCILNLNDSKHSLLSAYFYLDYFAYELECIISKVPVEAKMRIYLYELLFINSYLILKHHSRLEQYEQILFDIQEGGKLNNLDKQIVHGDYKKIYKGKFSCKSFSNYVRILSDGTLWEAQTAR